MTNKQTNIAIFSALAIVVGVVGYIQFKKIQEDIKKNW